MTSATSDAAPGPTPPGSIGRWVVGARLRTLPAAVVPVALGAAVAVDLLREQGWWETGVGPMVRDGASYGPVWWRVGLALVVSLALQVAVNYANDYSDGVKGTDDVRVGPTRLVAGGLASARSVKLAAFVAFGVAGLAGLVLAAATSWWLLAVGAVSMLAGWGYTGGPKPYGYLGLGEVFVFVFFGLVATVGTTYVAVETVIVQSVVAGCVAGALACALLVINNLRDIPTDREVGKRTLAVRIGDRATRWLYVGLLAASFVGVVVLATWRPPALLGLAGLPLAIAPVRSVLGGADGAALIPVLGSTGRVQLVTGLACALGLALGA
ncbi:MAG: 1,4-dihydroxy-2-naphthoate polyprenyltransferase [Actinomycetota bacterium]